jgi:hypothetical protein
VAEFVQFTLDDGSVVLFESADGSLVSARGGQPDVIEGGSLTSRIHQVAKAAEEISRAMRSRIAPDELRLEFGLKVSGGVNWWFFAKTEAESAIKVTLTWADTGQDAKLASQEGRIDHNDT